MNWNVLASSSYGAASRLAREQRYERSAVSRAYYAAYSRAVHALVTCDCGVAFPVAREGPSHTKLPGLIENHLRVLGQYRWRVADHLRDLYTLRVMADYCPSELVETAAALKAVSLMIQVFVLTKGAVDEP